MVADLNDRVLAAGHQAAHADRNFKISAFWGVAQRIGHQVGNHLAQPGVVSERRGRDRAGAFGQAHQRDLALGSAHLGVFHCVQPHDQQVHGLLLQRALLIKAGQHQQVVNQAGHALGFSLDAAHGRVQGVLGLQSAVAVELGVALDGHQRGAQLMGGILDEAAHFGLGGFPVAEGLFNLCEHRVQRPREAAHFGFCRVVGDAFGIVAIGDHRGGAFNFQQRPQRPAGQPVGDHGHDQGHQGAGGQHQHAGLAHRAVDLVQRQGNIDVQFAAGQRYQHGAPVRGIDVAARNGARGARM